MTIEFDVTNDIILPEVRLLTPSMSEDHRGNIWSSFISKDIDELLPGSLRFTHDKFSESKENVLRGIHGDSKSWKLVTCVYGKIFQVVVDMRPSSSTFLKWNTYSIQANKPSSILVPPGYGNAYFAHTSKVVYHYKLAYVGQYFDVDEQFTVDWDDPRLQIPWPTTDPILSARDRRLL